MKKGETKEEERAFCASDSGEVVVGVMYGKIFHFVKNIECVRLIRLSEVTPPHDFFFEFPFFPGKQMAGFRFIFYFLRSGRPCYFSHACPESRSVVDTPRV